jgi:exodeoxyribonuclease V beta subunit
MRIKPHKFDAAGGNLHKGVNLVEASAGTGKTYAIAMLVLRAIVELNISIDKILIVTFTKAATEELRSRIRARLVEGRDILNGAMHKPDPTLKKWAVSVVDKESALQRLKLALCDIDRAGIFTIHSFCQRMLVDQAMESGQLFDVELLADVGLVYSEVVDDFWRNRVYPLDSLPCSIVLQEFTNPQKLLESVKGGVKGYGRIEPTVGSIASAIALLETAFRAMASWWRKNSGQLIEQLEKIRSDNGFKKRLTESFDTWLGSVNAFFSETTEVMPVDLHLLQSYALIEELNGRKYRGGAKKEILDSCNLPGSVIDDFLDAANKILITLRVQLAIQLQNEVTVRLNERGLMSFDDLITRLSKALQGERGQDLQKIIRERFQIALIDEFQDTDSTQWYIFSECFARLTHYLYLIGDPKQAIYKFRGADIYSYFQARLRADHQLTLDKNYRSHPFLVEQVNSLFMSRPNPFFVDLNRIDYHPVQPAKTDEDLDLRRDNKSLAGMVYCLLPEDEQEKAGRWTSGKAAKEFTHFAAAEITRLLDPAEPTLLKKKNEKERVLRPKDIAILVRSNRQAAEYLQILKGAGIPAIVSVRESVFKSEECKELYILLHAVAQPGELSRLKTALSLRWFGFKGHELFELWQDDERFNQWYERFLTYSSLWQKDGFMVMMNRLIVDEGVYLTLASHHAPERSITNIQHLLELIQDTETSEHFHLGQTLLWLRRMMETDSGGEIGELRLESDEEAVQIVTMHGVKGLEYPVVFCPYLWYRLNRLKKERYCISSHDDENNLIIDLGSDEFDTRREAAIKEEMAEDLRLLYVALTRATLRCYVMWGDVKAAGIVGDSFDSALGYLLFPGGGCPVEKQQQKLQELAGSVSAQCINLAGSEQGHSFYWPEDSDVLEPMLPSGRDLHTDWQMSSYSALTALTEHEDDILERKKETAEVIPIPVPGLPAGPDFGNAVHEILETIPFDDLVDPIHHEAAIKEKCKKYGVKAEQEALQLFLKNIVSSPLGDFSGRGWFTLATLPESSCLREMEFYFRMSRLETDMINHVLAKEPAVCRLSHKVMQGYLTGLIDLICEHDGRYYIIDYKTNYLGDAMVDYARENLSHGMRSHNYGLQFWIYTLVLHRHLKNVFYDYRYESHFGGVLYLFVRGMKPDMKGNGVFSIVPDLKRLEELDRILGGEDGG